MAEFRRNPITGDWVLYAEERAARPNDYRAEAGSAECPFCPGNERLTPHEIVAGRPGGSPPDTPGWRWRIVPNKFPALLPDDPKGGPAVKAQDWRPAAGRHEALIETPRHEGELAVLSTPEIIEALRACAGRMAALVREPGVRWVLVFKNRGHAAGASLRHPHFQIVALPFAPKRIEAQLKIALENFEGKGTCISCEWCDRERKGGSRVIAADEDFLVAAPSGGRFPGETWIMPARHAARFEDSSAQLLEAAAGALRKLLVALKAWADDPPYNLVILTAPGAPNVERYCHWRIEVIPRFTGVAGFEWASGMHINQVTPEQAAAGLREVWKLLSE